MVFFLQYMWLSLYNNHRSYKGELYHKEVRKKMPLYEYQCSQCQDRFELLQPMNVTTEENAKLECPQCGAINPKKILSTFCGQTTHSLSSGGTNCATPVG